MQDTNLILLKAVENGIIDLNTVCQEVMTMERDKILAEHTSIWQGKDGFFYTKINADGKKRLIKRKTREEIEDYVIDFHEKQGAFSPTVSQIQKEWLEEKIYYKEICKGTADRYRNEYLRYFEELSDRKICEITEEELEDFIRSTIATKGLTAKAFSNLRTQILGIFKYAKKKKYTDISISEFFGDLDISKKVFKKNKKDDSEQVFSVEERKKVIEYLKNNPTVENLGILLTFQTGIREGELSALKFTDIQGQKLHIQRQEIKYKAEKGKVNHDIVDYTKTDAGDRMIYLPKEALDTIEMIREANPNGEYLMMQGNHKILTNTFNDRLYKACTSVGIPKRSMHKIRKTYGTMLIDNGVSESLIKQQMGHSDISTTRRFYYYSTKEDGEKLNTIERVFGLI